MPVADFPGRFGWGYDGVNLFAPTRLYGKPDDSAGSSIGRTPRTRGDPRRGLQPPRAGRKLSRAVLAGYFSERHATEWGEALNFDGEDVGAGPRVFPRERGYWIDEYHLDGLRLDATQQIFDESARAHLAAIAREVRDDAPRTRDAHRRRKRAAGCGARPPAERGGYGLDALWNDDFHHTAIVALTGRSEAYYTDYHGSPQEFVSAAKWGYLYQGQRYKWQRAGAARRPSTCRRRAS